MKGGYKDFTNLIQELGGEMPKNKGGGNLFLRHLDCAVINHIQ